MDKRRTDQTLDALADLYLTGTESSAPADRDVAQAREPSSAPTPPPAPGRAPFRLMPKIATVAIDAFDPHPLAAELDPLEQESDDREAIAILASPSRPRLAASPVMPTSPTLTSRQTPSAQTLPDLTVEVVVLGNLPGIASPWLTQYAHRLAQQHGPVAVLHVDAEQIDFDLVGTLQHREPLEQVRRRLTLQSDDGLPRRLRWLLNADPFPVTRWLIHLTETTSTQTKRFLGLDRWTILSGADDAAAVAAYRWLKQALVEQVPPLPAHVGLMIMGSDEAAAGSMAKQFQTTTQRFLQTQVQWLGAQKQMVPVHVESLGSFVLDGEGMDQLLNEFHRRQHPEAWDALDEESVTMPAIATGHDDMDAPVATLTRASDEPDDAATLDMDLILPPPPSPPEVNEPEASGASATAFFRQPNESEASGASATGLSHPQTTPSPTAEPAVVVAASSSLEQFVNRLKTNPSSAPLMPRPRPAPASSPVPPPVPVVQEPVADAAANRTPDVEPVRLPPQPPKPEPTPAWRAADDVAGPDEVDLGAFLVDGGVKLAARCPHHPDTQLLLDEDGRLHLLMHHVAARQPSLREAVIELLAARHWVRRHLSLLELTQRQLRFDPQAQPTLHLFTDDAKPAVAIVHDLQQDVRVHLLRQVSVGSQSAWFSTELN
ncbi:MAG: hypothetical protein IT440_09670 [Phycisphaeraceae bacterium]|nr:hypothetical protein [Phycisphaeraceae bacterium]